MGLERLKKKEIIHPPRKKGTRKQQFPFVGKKPRRIEGSQDS